MCDDREDRDRLLDIQLDDANFRAPNPEIQHERRVAIYDLLEENSFRIVGLDAGPYRLRLSRRENRLILELSGENGAWLADVSLAMSPFRKIIRDYFAICESYYDAIKASSPSRIEAIDMGRRALHDEGAEVLRTQLAGQIDIDENTARRLFTLICVLHVRG